MGRRKIIREIVSEEKKIIETVNENKVDNNDIDKKIDLCKLIQSNINNLSENELYEIFKILHKHNSKYTKNNNGIFVNLNLIDYNILEEIYNYIFFCMKSHKEISKYEILKDIYNKNLEIETDKNKNSNIKTIKKKENEEDEDECEEDNVITHKMQRVSSSMKFYLFKKKFLKKNIGTTNQINTNILTYEEYLIKNDL